MADGSFLSKNNQQMTKNKVNLTNVLAAQEHPNKCKTADESLEQ